MKYSIKIIIGVFIMITFLSVEGKVVSYDFGTEKSSVQNGFSRITAQTLYETGKSAGFRHNNQLKSLYRGGEKRTPGEFAWKNAGSYRRTTDVTCDFVEGSENNTFSTDIENGVYTVLVVASDRDWAPPFFEVWANGVKKLDVKLPRRRFVFFETFQVDVKKNRLDIVFKGKHGWLVNAIVIGKGKEMERAVADLEKNIFMFPDEDAQLWHKTEKTVNKDIFKFTNKEKETGYVIYNKDYMNLIFPDDAPERCNVGNDLNIFAAQGEIEPATFCIYAFKKLKNVDVTVSDFKDRAGNSIESSNINVNIVKCQAIRENYVGTSGKYHIGPKMLVENRRRNRDVPQRESKQWWLTLRVPENTLPGVYSAYIKIKPENAVAKQLKVNLLVLPFKLNNVKEKGWSTWLSGFPPFYFLRGPASRGRNISSEIDKMAKAEVSDYLEHGFNMFIIPLRPYCLKQTGSLERDHPFDLSLFINTMKYLNQPGFENKMAVVDLEHNIRDLQQRFADKKIPEDSVYFSSKAKKAIIALVKQLERIRKEYNWEKFYYFPIDEPGNLKTLNRYRFAEQVLDMVHEVKGCKTAATVMPKDIQRLGKKRIDLSIYSFRHADLSGKNKDKNSGLKMFYNNEIFYGRDPRITRAWTGFKFLRSGYTVSSAWGLTDWASNPENDLDHCHTDWAVLLPGLYKPQPSIYWEICREGIDDCRYVETLKNAVKNSKEDTRNAKKLLKNILSGDAPEIEDSRQFQRLRWRIAREIIRLQDKTADIPALILDSVKKDIGSLSDNLLPNGSFEKGPVENGFPKAPFTINDQFAKRSVPPVGAIKVTAEKAYSGKYSLKFDFSESDGKGYFAAKGKRYLLMNVDIPPQILKKIRGRTIRVQAKIMTTDPSGMVLPGIKLREYTKTGIDGTLCKDKYQDTVVWNTFMIEKNIAGEARKVDIHVFAEIPQDDKIRAKTKLYFDDFSIQVYPDSPLKIMTGLEDYYTGEEINWRVEKTRKSSPVSITLEKNGRVISKKLITVSGRKASGSFSTKGLKDGIYSLHARIYRNGKIVANAKKQVIVSQNPVSVFLDKK